MQSFSVVNRWSNFQVLNVPTPSEWKTGQVAFQSEVYHSRPDQDLWPVETLEVVHMINTIEAK